MLNVKNLLLNLELMAQKYIFDKETLTYVPYRPAIRQRLKKAGKYVGVGVIVAMVLFSVTAIFSISPISNIKKVQNSLIVNKLLSIERQLENQSKILSAIEEKDDALYRIYVSLAPLPATIRQAGFGGTDRYRKFEALQNGQLLSRITQKADILENQIHIQQKSFDDIQSLGEEKIRYLSSVPGICPMKRSDYFRISDYFGGRFHPVFGVYKSHTGIDYAALPGSPVYATGDGVVVATGWDNGYGVRVMIDHGFGYSTIYAHLQRFVVRVGDKIKRGKLIGFVGNTGVSTGPHLHYEVRKNNEPVNPIYYYIDDISDEEYKLIAHK